MKRVEKLENNINEEVVEKQEEKKISKKKRGKKIFRKIKNLIKFLLVELFKSMFRLIILGLAIFVISKLIKIDNRKPAIPEKVYLEISLDNKVLENKIKNPFDIDNKINFYGLLNKLDKIEKDKRVQGIVLKLGNTGLNRAQIEELKEKASELKEKDKKIYVYSEGLDNHNYNLALIGNEIIMPNNKWAHSYISGYSARYPYYKNLGDKLFIGANVIHIGDYKSFGETYVSSEMSQEFRENTTRLLDKLYNNYISNIKETRGIKDEKFNEKVLNGEFVMVTPEILKENKIIDEIMYYEEFLEKREIKELITIDDYFQRLAEEIDYKIIENKDKIAVIYAEGSITSGDNPQIENKIEPDVIKDKLLKADKLANVKGIVLRINSPGGLALASDIIYEAIRKVEKPVYISMGGAAASGGYYIASAGDKIYANKETITGSIGVVSIIPDVSKLVEKMGINYEEITNGKFTNLYDITKPLSKEERDKIYYSSLEGYEEFISKVALGRNMKIEDVQKIAQGKVWLGEEAKEIGLVDEIGGLEKTISDLAKDLELKDYTVIESLESRKLEEIFRKFLPKYIFSKLSLNIGVEKILQKDEFLEEFFYKPVVYAPNLEIYY